MPIVASAPPEPLQSAPGRAGTRLFAWLTGKAHAEPLDVQEALLLTLPEPPVVLAMAFFWTQAAAWIGFAITHAPWALAWAGADIVLTSFRFALQWRHAAAEKARRRPPRRALLAVNAAWFASIIAGVPALLASGGVTLLLLGTVLAIGFMGYAASRCAAFPRFAAIVLHLLAGSLTLGLWLTPTNGTGLIALLAPFGGVAFHVLHALNHETLVKALRLQQQHLRLSMHDALTDLPNRLLMRERLTEMCEQVRADAAADSFSVLCIDLDGFKAVNDRYGHAGGDWLLKSTGQRLRAAVRTQDIVCRIGGDEFVVLLPCTGAETAAVIAARIVEVGSQTHDLGRAAQARAGISVGIATAPEHGVDADSLLSCADDALYAAKRSGKSTWCLFGQEPVTDGPPPR